MPTIAEINKELKERFAIKNKLASDLTLPIELVYDRHELGVETVHGEGNLFTLWEKENIRVTLVNTSQTFLWGINKIKRGWVIKVYKTKDNHWALEVISDKAPFAIPDLSG